MRLRSLHIDGYGRFTNHRIDNLSSGLTVFQGHNEAGKSTLLAFIRDVLFGFPDKRQTENQYLPLTQAPHGGRISLEDESGAHFTVQRLAGKRGGKVTVTTGDDRVGDEAMLQELLGSAGRGLFRNVFAFSLGELQRFETLADDEVRSALYSAGLGSSTTNLSKVAKELSARAEALFKPGGSKPEINDLLRQLEAVRAESRQLGDQPGKYQERVRQLESLRAHATTVDEELSSLNRQHLHTKRVLEAWPTWVKWDAVSQELQQLPPNLALPPDSLSQLKLLQGRLSDLRDRAAVKGQRLETEERLLEQLVPDLRLLDQSESLRRLAGHRSEWDRIQRELPGLHRQEQELFAQVQQSLAQIHADWDLQRLNDTDISIGTRDHIRVHQSKLLQCERNDQQAQDRLAEADRELAHQQQLLEDASQALQDAPASDQTLRGLHGSKLADLRGQWRQAEEVARRTQQGQTEASTSVAEALQRLGPGWTAERVSAAEPDASALQSVVGHRDALAQKREDVHQARREFEALEQQQRALLADREALPGLELSPTTRPTRECERLRDRLLEARADLQKRDKWAAAADKARDRLDTPEPGAEAVPLWLVAVPLVVGMGLAAMLIQQELSKMAAVAFVLMAAFAGAMYLWRASTLDRTAKAREEHSRRTQEARAQVGEAEAELLALEQRLTAAATDLGLSPPVSAQDLDRLDRELIQEAANAEARGTQELQERQLGEKIERAIQHLQAATATLELTTEAQSLATDEWNHWLETHKLPANLVPDTARDLLSDLLEAAKALRHAARQNDVAEESIERALTLRRELSEILQSAGRNTFGSDLGDQITTLISDLEKNVEIDNQRANLQRRLAEAQRDADRSVAKTTAAQHARKSHVEASQRAALEWQRVKGDLPAETPEAALEVLQRAAAAQNLLTQALAEKTKREETEKIRDDLYLQATEIFRIAGRGQPAQDGLATSLDRLLVELEQAEKDHEKRAQLLAQRADDTEPLEILRERIESVQHEIHALFDVAGAPDEPSFRSAVAVEKTRSALVQELQSLETNLNIARGGGDLAEFTEDLSRADTDELLLRLQILETTIEQCKERLAELQRDQGRAQQELAALETSDERATLRQREELLKETLRVRAREWAAAALASHVLEKARHNFERERQPDVIKRASEHFSAMTGGRYTRLVAPPGDNKVVMELADGTRRDTSDLSRGTAEQAYLALRLGFVHEFSRRSEPLPLIMDDIFVNFDPERAVAAMKEVLTLADRHQVLLFTCHPETVARVRHVDPNADVRELIGVH